MTDDPNGGFFNLMLAVVYRMVPFGIGTVSSISTVVWLICRGYSKHKQHHTSHLISDCATRMHPERNQKPKASQLSIFIVERSTELRRIKPQHVKIAGVSWEYEYRGVQSRITLMTKITARRKVHLKSCTLSLECIYVNNNLQQRFLPARESENGIRSSQRALRAAIVADTMILNKQKREILHEPIDGTFKFISFNPAVDTLTFC